MFAQIVNVEWVRGNNCQRARFKSKYEISGAQTVRLRPVHTEHVDISSIFIKGEWVDGGYGSFQFNYHCYEKPLNATPTHFFTTDSDVTIGI